MNIKKLKTSLLLSSRLTKVLIVSSVDYLVFLISIYLVLYFELSQKLPIPSLTFKPFVFSALRGIGLGQNGPGSRTGRGAGGDRPQLGAESLLHSGQ